MTSLIKMDSVWSEELEDKLVDLWQEHECLYQVTAGSYLLSILPHCTISSQSIRQHKSTHFTPLFTNMQRHA